MKRLATLLLFFCILSGMNTIAFASSDVKIKVNSSLLSDAQAILKDGSTLLPVRSVSTALGCEVIWDNETKTASIDKDDTSVNITIGQKEITVNNKKQAISTPAQIVNGRTYVPLHALGEALECDITWVNETKTVEISQLDPSEYKAWYEVDKQGRLVVNTNINSNKWDGYTIVTILDVDNKNWKSRRTEVDTEHREKQGTVQLRPRGFYSHFEDGTVIKSTELYFFKGIIPTLKDDMKNPKKEIAMVSDKLVYQTTLKNKIAIEENEQLIHFTELKVSINPIKMEETYFPTITEEIQKSGEYDLKFEKTNRNGYGGGLNRTNAGLEITTDLGYYPHKNSIGTFHIEHYIYTMDNKGHLTLTKTLSNKIDGKALMH